MSEVVFMSVSLSAAATAVVVLVKATAAHAVVVLVKVAAAGGVVACA